MDQQLAPPSSPFEKCPFEIASQIASIEIERSDVLNLRLASRRMCHLFTPLGFHQYAHCIKLSASGIENSKKRVLNQPAYSPIPAAFAPHITRLQVHAWPLRDFANMESANTVDADGNRKFGRFWKEISQLTSVKWFEWAGQSAGEDDIENAKLLSLLDKTISAVQAASASGHYLQTIRIFSKAHFGLPNSLVHLDGLSEFVVESQRKALTRPEERQRALASQIRSIITRHGSTLQRISLQLSPDTYLNLEDIFPPEAIELRLTSVLLPRMEYSVPEGLAKVPQLYELITHNDNACPSEADHIWDALRVHRIAVRKTEGSPTIGRMNYLGSYSGLTNLFLAIHPPLDPAIVDLFFGAVLPAQAMTLETIWFRYYSKMPAYDGFVYSSRYRWFGRLFFPRLRRLSVYAPSDWDINQSRCQSLLDDLQDFPVLETFSVQWPKYTQMSPAFNREDLPLYTKTGRPSRFRIEVHEEYFPKSVEFELGKLDS